MLGLVSSPGRVYRGQGEECEVGAGEAGKLQAHGDERRERGMDFTRPADGRPRCCQSRADRPEFSRIQTSRRSNKTFSGNGGENRADLNPWLYSDKTRPP